MPDEPIDLDQRRGNSARKATESRRQRVDAVHAHHAATERRQDELERLLMAGPAATWPEAAARARYLLQLFASTSEGREPRRRELIALALDDLTRLGEHGRPNS